ncbi:TauD/TfdA family dioxygenase [Legionella brunensis]|uniref:TauD/TfdA-like domain-containing protein n=1 Tax=Legionella brunensis TaxID=29422 RepID=A0A0W0SLG0_9GAMM|nr:TauD/TfdA family dioxygenase [Legionella brunensis]KTC84100.1 hypothetical protein Lbru_1461 [Legionella brunensis]
MDDFSIQEGFPTFITLKKNAKPHNWRHLLVNNLSQIRQLLLKNGAFLFRDFPLSTVEHFTDFISTINLGNFVNYIGGDSPRDKVTHKIYTSTEAPPNIYIPLHQELSYLQTYPQHIYFFCEVAPKFQGETVIADARKIFQALNPDVVTRFQNKSVTYISHYYRKSKLMEWINYLARSHKSWIDVFETDQKQIVEAFCQSNEIKWKWLNGDWIEIKHTRPALLQHPITKETVWFNQAHLYDFNVKLLGLWRFLAVKLVYFRRLTRLHEVTFADGSTIPHQDLYHILDVLEEHTVPHPWAKGDVMILDNVLTMHGRSTFKGKRRILTALTT